MSTHTPRLVARTFHGLEDVLIQELTALGATHMESHKRAVSFDFDKKLMYKANLHARTALRILQPIHQKTVHNPRQLYQRIQEINWSDYLNLQDTFAIDTTVYSPYFKHSKYVALKAKDAIVDQFRAQLGKRPSIDVLNPSLRIHLYINNNQLTISLDSSGDSLHKRGYRTTPHAAPLNEVLAAGLIALSGWDKQSPFLDPMCGSGTIVIEAALMALHTPANWYRKQFGFQHWKDFDQTLWQEVRNEAAEQFQEIDFPIIGADVDGRSVDIARENVKRAKLKYDVSIKQVAFEQHLPPMEAGTIMMNPPYGERLHKEDVQAFYKQIGDQLKQHYAGYEAWILSSNKAALKHVGLRPSQKMTLYNGALECKFQRYSLYKGSKKKV